MNEKYTKNRIARKNEFKKTKMKNRWLKEEGKTETELLMIKNAKSKERDEEEFS